MAARALPPARHRIPARAPDQERVATASREIKEITAEVAEWIERQRISVGLLILYIPHTSASLLIKENASPDVRRDLGAFLHRIVPENIALYRHNDEGPDDMPAHIKSALNPDPAHHPRHRRSAGSSAPGRASSCSSTAPRRTAAPSS